MGYAIAKYLRISAEDIDLDGFDKYESNSISNQRALLDNFISGAPEFAGCEVIEELDDGQSGVNFSRPGIQRLLEMAQAGKLNCIIVKDLSRFGRNYLEVGDYLEKKFPEWGVRFISLNDRYDSDGHKGATADIDVVFRNLMNAMYSKDISKKVKTAKLTRIRQGNNINAFVSYGYKKNVADKHRLEIDEPAALIVKRIFKMSSEGFTPTQIAKILNAEGEPTPSEYKKQNGSKLKILTVSCSIWSNGIVNNILRNEQYLGTLICGKAEVEELGSKKVVYKPEKDWIKVYNAHPAIITQEVWDAVRLKKSQANYSNYKKPNVKRFLYKKIRCGHCGHIMRYRLEAKKNGNGAYSYYCCETPRLTNEYGCTSAKHSPQELEVTVKSAVMAQMTLLLDTEKICGKAKKDMLKIVEMAKKSVKRIDNEIERLETSKQWIYEHFRLNEIDMDEYMNQREKTEAKISVKKKERDGLLSKCEKSEFNKTHQFLNSIIDYKNASYLSSELVGALVETVYIFSAERIEIAVKFKDESKTFYRLDS